MMTDPYKLILLVHYSFRWQDGQEKPLQNDCGPLQSKPDWTYGINKRYVESVNLMKKTTTLLSVTMLTAVVTLVTFSVATSGYVSPSFSQMMSNATSQTNQSGSMGASMSGSNMTSTNSNASSMESNITGANANNTNASAPHAANMTPEKVLAPNGTAPS